MKAQMCTSTLATKPSLGRRAAGRGGGVASRFVSPEDENAVLCTLNGSASGV